VPGDGQRRADRLRAISRNLAGLSPVPRLRSQYTMLAALSPDQFFKSKLP